MLSAVLYILSLGLLALPASAQAGNGDQHAINEECYATFRYANYPRDGTYYYSTTDGSAFTATYTYDTTKCNSSVPLNRFTLTEEINFVTYRCTNNNFGAGTGVINVQCSRTKFVSPHCARSAMPPHRLSADIKSANGHSIQA